jgi:hypothetical protein
VERPEPLAAARSLVAHRYPEATQAWLSGSVVLGGATPTSDLDITVLLEDADVHRESLVHDGWPVELFVHSEESIRHFVAKDLQRRRPTMARLVATGVQLVEGDGGARVREECAATVGAGPGPLPGADLDLARYTLTDQLDDLAGAGTGLMLDAIAVDVWHGTAELRLAAAGWWGGQGKWLARELEELDEAEGSSIGPRLHAALHAALAGDPGPLTEVADEVLDRVGGRLWAGFHQAASLPE